MSNFHGMTKITIKEEIGTSKQQNKKTWKCSRASWEGAPAKCENPVQVLISLPCKYHYSALPPPTLTVCGVLAKSRLAGNGKRGKQRVCRHSVRVAERLCEVCREKLGESRCVADRERAHLCVPVSLLFSFSVTSSSIFCFFFNEVDGSA